MGRPDLVSIDDATEKRGAMREARIPEEGGQEEPVDDVPAGQLRPYSARDKRIVRLAIATASLGSSVMLIAAYANAVSHDPWLTPRLVPYMLLWWRVSGALRALNAASAVGCAIALYYTPGVRWRVADTLCLILSVVALQSACWYCG